MAYAWLANAVALLHLAFVLFIPLGGLVAWRWPAAGWAHLGCAAWGAVIAGTDVVCPLTPLEKTLRVWAGGAGYEGGFIRHYLVPAGLPGWAVVLFWGLALLLNASVYLPKLARTRRALAPSQSVSRKRSP